MERFAKAKHSSLFGSFVSLEENKVLWIQPAPGAVFTTLHFLCNLQKGPVSYSVLYTRLERLGKDKHSSLMGPFITYDEKGCMVNTSQWPLNAWDIKLYKSSSLSKYPILLKKNNTVSLSHVTLDQSFCLRNRQGEGEKER